MTHNIKLDISFCDLVYSGVKTFEVRRNDRNYQIGDLICFQPVEHPVNDKIYEITYVLSGWGIQEGFVVFAIKECELKDEDS